VEIEPVNFLERAAEHRAGARLQRNDERKGGVRIARPLQNSVDTDPYLVNTVATAAKIPGLSFTTKRK